MQISARSLKFSARGLTWPLAVLLLLAAIACGTAATQETSAPVDTAAQAAGAPAPADTSAPAAGAPAPADTSAPAQSSSSPEPAAAMQPTAVAQPAATVQESETGRDDVIIVLDDEPPGLNTYHHSQGGRIHRENLNDPLGWFDKDNRELVPLSPLHRLGANGPRPLAA